MQETHRDPGAKRSPVRALPGSVLLDAVREGVSRTRCRPAARWRASARLHLAETMTISYGTQCVPREGTIPVEVGVKLASTSFWTGGTVMDMVTRSAAEVVPFLPGRSANLRRFAISQYRGRLDEGRSSGAQRVEPSARACGWSWHTVQLAQARACRTAGIGDATIRGAGFSLLMRKSTGSARRAALGNESSNELRKEQR